MKAIILEGPDESGKTTLATALLGYYNGKAGYLKSPAGRSPEWSPYYNSWVQRATSDQTSKVWILDRCPEISEAVYGPIMRGSARLANPTASILSIPKDSALIFCQSPLEGLETVHTATMDIVIGPANHIKIMGGYAVMEEMCKTYLTTYRWYKWRTEQLWEALVYQLDRGTTFDQIPSFKSAVARGAELVPV